MQVVNQTGTNNFQHQGRQKKRRSSKIFRVLTPLLEEETHQTQCGPYEGILTIQ